MVTPRIILLAELEVEEKLKHEPYSGAFTKCSLVKTCLLAKAINDLIEKDKKIMEELEDGNKCQDHL